MLTNFPTNSLCVVVSSAQKSFIDTNSGLKNKKGPELTASERLKTWPVRDKAWHSRTDMVLGDIDSRAWSMVGKEIGHTRTMETVNNVYLWTELELGVITIESY